MRGLKPSMSMVAEAEKRLEKRLFSKLPLSVLTKLSVDARSKPFRDFR